MQCRPFAGNTETHPVWWPAARWSLTPLVEPTTCAVPVARWHGREDAGLARLASLLQPACRWRQRRLGLICWCARPADERALPGWGLAGGAPVATSHDASGFLELPISPLLGMWEQARLDHLQGRGHRGTDGA